MKALLLGFMVLFASALMTDAAPVELNVAYEDKTQFPYYMGNTSEVLDQPGVAVEMVQLLEKEIPNLTVNLHRFPWGRCLSRLKQGVSDGIFNASFKPSRMEIGRYPWKDGKVDPSRRLTTISYSLYKRKQSPLAWDGVSFANLEGKIGAPRAYSIVGDLRKMGVAVEESPWTKNDFKKLIRDRIAGVAAQDVTGDFLLEQHRQEFESIVKVTPPLKVKPYYLMLSHQFVNKYPELAEQIWDTLAKIREESLAPLAKKYLGLQALSAVDLPSRDGLDHSY